MGTSRAWTCITVTSGGGALAGPLLSPEAVQSGRKTVTRRRTTAAYGRPSACRVCPGIHFYVHLFFVVAWKTPPAAKTAGATAAGAAECKLNSSHERPDFAWQNRYPHLAHRFGDVAMGRPRDVELWHHPHRSRHSRSIPQEH